MAARVHATDTYDVPDADDDTGPCEDIVVLAKTHSAASEDTYCGSDYEYYSIAAISISVL